MLKIVFLDAGTMGDTPLDSIAALGELTTYYSSTAEEARERVRDADVALLNKVIVDSLVAGAKAFVSKNATEGFEIENFTRAIACLERGERYYFNHPVLQTLVESASDYVQQNFYSLKQCMHYDVSMRERELLIGLARGETAIQVANRIYGKADDSQIKSIQNLQKALADRINNGDNKASALVARAIFLGILTEDDVYKK